MSRGELVLRREPVDLAAVVGHAVAAVQPAVEQRRHTLTVSIEPREFQMVADPTRLEQVVSNLLTNAAKYTEPGGEIAVALTREEQAGTPPQAALRVRDSGRGIPRDLLERIFEPFMQVSPGIDRSTGGLGLGLTLVRRLVAMHGGRVTAASEGPGKGSELVVRLPLDPAVPATASPRVL